jgi:hypothetical protein
MSDRLAISASFSVLMMAIYVLFGENIERVPLSPSRLMPGAGLAAGMKTPELPRSPGEFLRILD